MQEPRIVTISDIKLAGQNIQTCISENKAPKLWKSFHPLPKGFAKVEQVLCIFSLMKPRLSIFTFLLLLIMSSNFQLSAEAVHRTHSAEIEAVLGSNEIPFGPASQGELFSTSNTAESSIQLREYLFESSTEEETRDYNFTYFLNDSDLKTPGFIYLGFSDLIHCSQTIRTLIFPFHSYL